MANSTDASDTNPNWSLYPYEPNRAAPIAFALLLTLIALYQTHQSFIQYHWRKFGLTMLWASTVWLAAFTTRALSTTRPRHIPLFITQYVLLLLGPPLYAAAESFILGRLLAYLPYHAPLHPGRVIPTFVFLSACVESLTANGAANAGGGEREAAQRARGIATLKAALILQCGVELAFASLVATVQHKCHRASGRVPRKLRPVFALLYLTSAMMLIRCIARAIEGFEAPRCRPWVSVSTCGYASRHEWVLWVFEVANITVFVLLLAVFHPGRYLPRDSRVFLDVGDRVTERVGPGFGEADRRPRWQTVVDPFRLWPTVTGRGLEVERFWEGEWPVYEGGPLPKKGKGKGREERGSDEVKLSEVA